ncbi:MAG: hypothetical protein KF824_12315 [Fimbriimonadaceae bacterium]|nr:MAG: hypothetical protein KF824_12315 [Fimbriimonadaceae bacterium]
MRGTQILIGLSMVVIVTTTASFPRVANGAPQLVTTMAGAGLAPQIGTGGIAGGMRAAGQAKENKKLGDARAKEANSLMSGEGGASVASSLASKVFQAGEIVQAFNANSAKAAKELVGAPVSAQGVVIKVVPSNEKTLVYLAPPNAKSDAPLFAFRFEGNHPFELGKPVELQGKFMGRMKMDGLPNDIYLVDATVEGAGGGAASAPKEPEKPKVPFDGWKFVGSVEAEGGATGVFTKEGQTLYAQAGDTLSEGIKVGRLKSGEAVLIQDGKSSVVMPW